MTQPLFNSQLFLQSLAGDEELARELLQAFMEDSPERQKSLGEAVDSGDLDATARLAHSLKGMCGVVRVDDLVSISLSMEHTAKTGDIEKIRGQYAQFLELLSAAHKEIIAFIE